MQHDFALARRRMVAEQIEGRGISDLRLLKVMQEMPRHLFVDQALWGQAYGDHPLTIGEGQTISQPYMVALMTDAMGLTGSEKVLEIGTGSGYQAAILARLSREVYSIERLASLSLAAQRVLNQLEIFNVHFKVGDGTRGWPENAPFDTIMVTAGAPDEPEPLKQQLAEGGRLVIPIGDRDLQMLHRITRQGDGFKREDLGGCRFVQLKGEYGW